MRNNFYICCMRIGRSSYRLIRVSQWLFRILLIIDKTYNIDNYEGNMERYIRI
nr:MAG TPA: hypothetical protein [Caudoviricetes sp.]